MAEPQRKPPSKPRVQPEDDIYAVREPVDRMMPSEEEILLTYRRPVTTVEEATPPPPAYFLDGVIAFPWYLQTLGSWIISSIGLALSGLGVVLAIWLVDNGLSMAADAMKLSICWIILLSLAYVWGCFQAIVEGTAVGNPKITEWPQGDWREWAMALGYPAASLAVTSLVAAAAAYVVALSQSWLVPLVVGLLVYPFVLLSTLENGSMIGFASRAVARTYVDLWWGWLIVYAISGAMFGGWLVWALWLYPERPFFTAGLSGPILAAMVFVYARLLGRLAWQAHEAD